MATFRTDRNQVFDKNGNLLSEEVVQVDITDEVIQARARQALTSNATFLALASPTNAQLAEQITRLTRQSNGLIRFLLKDFSNDTDT